MHWNPSVSQSIAGNPYFWNPEIPGFQKTTSLYTYIEGLGVDTTPYFPLKIGI